MKSCINPIFYCVVIEIVGAGLIGLSCAWELRRRAFDVVVYEMDEDRKGCSSWAGAGMIAAHGESFPDAAWQQRALESAKMYPAWVEAIGGNIDFCPPTTTADGHVDPRDLLRELAAQLPIEFRKVESLDDLHGEQVIVCAGAWSNLLGSLPAVEPVKGYLLAWDSIAPGSLKSILRDGHTYVFQRVNGRVVAGSTEQRIGFDRDTDPELISDLHRRAQALWPPLKDLPFDDCWFGFRPATADGFPVVERLGSRCIAAYGHYRNGILLAPWTARWVADEVQRQLGK